jgi:hypothetical protein
MEKSIREADDLPLKIATIEKNISDIKTELQTLEGNLQSSDPEGYAIYVNMVKELINNTSRARAERHIYTNSEFARSEFARQMNAYIKTESDELQALLSTVKPSE